MAEFLSPTYVHPDYATPEQLAQQRAYAEALIKRSGEPVNRPAGAFANMIERLTGSLERNRANEIQNQQAGMNAADMGALISQQQGGARLDPRTLGRIIANPLVGPEQRALALKLINPERVEDAAGRPGYSSPAQGVQATPVRGPFQPGIRPSVTAGDTNISAVPQPAPPLVPNRVRTTPVQPSPRVWGDKEAQDAGLYPPAPQAATGGGGQPPGAGLPPASEAALRGVAKLGRELSAARTFTQGGAESVSGVQKEDVVAAMNAPNIKTVAGVMLDDLRTHGDKMTFGPTADWSNRVKRIAANYAPGPMKSQLEAIASADSFDKMSAQLASMLSRGGGTDAQLFNNIKSVPGAHNSKEGAEALLKMVIQVADQQQGLREAVASARDANEYEILRRRYFEQNPIINPITGNPIARDFQNRSTQPGGGGGARIIGVEPAR